MMLLKETSVWVCLMIFLTVGAFEWVRTWFALLGLESQRICFFVGFVILCKVTIMFGFMRTIVFSIFGPLNSTWKDNIFSLLAVLTLGNTRVHVYTSNSGNMASYIKAPVNQSFCFTTTLDIPDVHPNNSHIQLGENFNNT